MARPSRSLKLLLPRLLEEPPLIDGPGPSLAVRSVRMRKGPLLNGGGVDSRDMSFLFKGNSVIEVNGLESNVHSHRMSPLLLAPPLLSLFQPPSLGERLSGMLGIVARTPIGRWCMGTGRRSSRSRRSISRRSPRGGGGGSARRTGSKLLG